MLVRRKTLTAGGKLRLTDILRNAPVLVKVMGVTVASTLILGGALAWQIHHAYYRLEKTEVESYSVFTARVLASAAAPLLREGKSGEVQQMLEQTARGWPAVHLLRVRDAEGRVVAQTVPGVSKAPLEKGSAELPPDVGGSVMVMFNDDHTDFELSWHTRRILIATGIITAFGFGLTWCLMHWATRSIPELVQVARAVKAGNYQVRASIRRNDEVGELAAAFNDMLAALEQQDAINHQLLRKTIAAAEEERKRVARELHDQTGQALTSLIAGLAAMETEPSEKRAAELRRLAAETLGEVHDLSFTLRPSALEDLGLVSALRKFCQGVAQRSGVDVDCEGIGLDGKEHWPDELELALYRICQEAVTNAVRHGHPTRIEVLVQRKKDSILAVIEDNGCGFEAEDWRSQSLRQERLGLLGIEERSMLLGGSLRIDSRPGRGTSLFIEVPLPVVAHD